MTQPASLDPLANVQVQRRPLQRLPRPCCGAAAGGASIRVQCQPAAAAATARADPCANTCTHARAHPGADACAHARPRGWRCGQTYCKTHQEADETSHAPTNKKTDETTDTAPNKETVKKTADKKAPDFQAPPDETRAHFCP